MKANLSALAHLGSPAESKVRQRCAGAVAEIEAASKIAWLSVDLDFELSRSVEAVCGRSSFKQWCHDAIVESIRSPLLSPIVDGLLRLGFGPEHAFRRIPGGWNLVYRHCGELVCSERSAKGATLVLEGAPPTVRDEVYAFGILAAFEGLASSVGGDDVAGTMDLDAEAARFRVTWS